jgi:23S rRNA (pseudouridine1915-N3)-methyltransferase
VSAVPGRIHIVAVGRLSTALAPAFGHYRRLLAPYATLRVDEVRHVALTGRTQTEVLRDEARRVVARLPQDLPVVVLDAGGRVYDSPAFAERLRQWLDGGGACFVLGGVLGLAPDVKARAVELLSLSRLTLPHQLARVVLAEQLYRGIKIARGEPYHY